MLACEFRVCGDLAVAVGAVAGTANLFCSLFGLGQVRLGSSLVLGLNRASGQKQRKQQGNA